MPSPRALNIAMKPVHKIRESHRRPGTAQTVKNRMPFFCLQSFGRPLLAALLLTQLTALPAAEPPEPRNGSKLIIVNEDGFSAFHGVRYTSADDLRKAMLALKATQVTVMEWCVIAGSRANYPSKVTELIGDGMTEFPRRGDKLAHETLKRIDWKKYVTRKEMLSGPGSIQSEFSLPLAADGRALLPITISAEAAGETRAVANELAGYLSKISGATFEVEFGDGSSGIVVGTVVDFPALLKPDAALTARENYLLRSEKDRLLLVGQTPQAVEHAVWDVLHRLGFRQFLPGPTWEIVPHSPTLGIDVNVTESPDYHARRIWAGYGYLKERAGVCEQWNRRNRATAGIALVSGHSYEGFMHRHEAALAQHPEFLALVAGKRQAPKLCTANAELRKLFIDDALSQFAKNPDLDSVSCDPSDGGGWCECSECAQIGTATDRALFLANEVAAAVNAKHPGRLIGMYAYNEHSPPPSIAAHPQVVISVATGFIQGGYTVDQLLAGWQAKAKILGIREYYSVHPWDRDLPGAARGGNIEYLRTTIPHFHQSGARFMSAEASDNAGPNGLGYYLAARMLWDVSAANHLDADIADFLDKSFGPARAPMAKFYTLLDGTKRQTLSDDLIGRMFRLLAESHALTTDAAIRARLNELTLYTR